jgi:hypothetical protein
LIKDWGGFAGQSEGYRIVEGDEEDITGMMVKALPYVRYRAYSLVSIDQMEKAIKAIK